MSTVLDVITSAMQYNGALAIGETPTAAEAQDGLAQLNNMLSMWNLESLMVYDVIPQVFPYIAGQSTYTIGPGGDFNTARPVRIKDAFTRDSAGNDYPIYVTENSTEYANLTSKYVQSTLPALLYAGGDFPLKTLIFYPVPADGGFSSVLWVWNQITAYANTAQTITLPPGYQHAIETNLAVFMCPKYSKKVTEDLKNMAIDGKATIMRINTTIEELGFDPALTGYGTGFNWLTGNPNNVN